MLMLIMNFVLLSSPFSCTFCVDASVFVDFEIRRSMSLFNQYISNHGMALAVDIVGFVGVEGVFILAWIVVCSWDIGYVKLYVFLADDEQTPQSNVKAPCIHFPLFRLP